MWVQSSDEFVEWEQDSIFSTQIWRLFWAIVDAIWSSREGIRGLEGSCERSWSRSRVSSREAGDKPGVKFGILPRGMYFLDEVRRMRRRMTSPDPHER